MRWVGGWRAGGGVEVAATQNLSFKVEALSLDLNDAEWLAIFQIQVTERAHGMYAIRKGVNWRF